MAPSVEEKEAPSVEEKEAPCHWKELQDLEAPSFQRCLDPEHSSHVGTGQNLDQVVQLQISENFQCTNLPNLVVLPQDHEKQSQINHHK